MGYTYRKNVAELNINKVIDSISRRRRKEIIGVVSLYGDPFHRGHLELLWAARELVDVLVVVVNTDHQARLKKGQPFMPEWDRALIIGEMSCVDHVVLSVDGDRSVNVTLELLRPHKFLNGGDVSSERDCREADTCREHGIEMVFGVGGYEKIRSSSELIRNARDHA